MSHQSCTEMKRFPDSKRHGANMGPTWVLLAPDGPHIGPMNLAITVYLQPHDFKAQWYIMITYLSIPATRHHCPHTELTAYIVTRYGLNIRYCIFLTFVLLSFISHRCHHRNNFGKYWGHIKIRMLFYQKRDSYDKDETVSQLSHLYNWNLYIWKHDLYSEMGPWMFSEV